MVGEEKRKVTNNHLLVTFSFHVFSGQLLAGEALVGVQADLGEFLGLGEEFVGALREQLVQGREADLSLQEVLELAPVGLLRVEGERVLVRAFESRPQSTASFSSFWLRPMPAFRPWLIHGE